MTDIVWSRIRSALGTITNLLFALVVVFVVAYYLVQWRRSHLPAPAVQASVGAPEYRVGDSIAGVLSSPEGQFQGLTLLVALRSSCRFCTESVPFYRRLMSSRPAGVRIIAVANEEQGRIEAYLRDKQLRFDAVTSGRGLTRVRRTPTLLLVDGGGVIRGIWTGLLTPGQEEEVRAALAPTAGREP